MSRHAANRLEIRPLSNGRFFLTGRVLGRQIRKRSRDYNRLAMLQAELELEVLKQRQALEYAPSFKRTRLTPEQLADAEAAVLLAGGRRLVEMVTTASRFSPPAEGITCTHAKSEWLAALAARKRSQRTIDKNRLRVDAFLAWAKVPVLFEITPALIEKYVYRPGADFTRLTDAQVLRAWLRFCCSPARRWLSSDPFEIDVKDLTATAQPKEPGRILSPAQCEALLRESANYSEGRLLVYAILTTWLFMRDSEARRVTRASFKLDGATPIVEVDTRKRRTVKYRNITVPANVLGLLRESVSEWPLTHLVRRNRKMVEEPFTTPFSRSIWATIRDRAGLLVRGKTTRGKRRPILKTMWQPDITRHTGISFLYQRTGDIKDVCRQAGNKTDVSFRHYLTLPAEGEAERFYAIAIARSHSRVPTGIPVVC